VSVHHGNVEDIYRQWMRFEIAAQRDMNTEYRQPAAAAAATCCMQFNLYLNKRGINLYKPNTGLKAKQITAIHFQLIDSLVLSETFIRSACIPESV
jgi:hypothetical protein